MNATSRRPWPSARVALTTWTLPPRVAENWFSSAAPSPWNAFRAVTSLISSGERPTPARTFAEPSRMPTVISG